MSQHVQLGSIGFKGQVLPFSLSPQTLPSIQTGAAPQRGGRTGGVIPFVLDDYQKGHLPLSGIGDWTQVKGRVFYNQGIMFGPWGASLPFVSTPQATLAAVDISGYRAANKRARLIMNSQGSASGARLYAFLGPNMYKDTSTSNPALTAPSTNDNLSDSVTAVWNGRANATDRLIVSTDGTTNDTCGTTDPTQNSVTWDEIVTHAHANDQIEAGWYLSQWDINVCLGTLNNTQRCFSFPGGAATLPYTTSTVRDVVYAATKDIPDPNATINTAGPYYPRTILGNTHWTNINNITANDGSYATRSTTDATERELRVADFHELLSLPASITITGVTTEEEAFVSNALANVWIDSVQLLAGAGSPEPTGWAKNFVLSGNAFPTSPTVFTQGGSQDTWGALLTPNNVRTTTFGFMISLGDGVDTYTTSVDYLRMSVSYQLNGTAFSLPSGATGFGNNPASATQRAVLAPTRAEPTAVTVEREMWLLDFDYDASDGRVIVNPSKTATLLNHVEDLCHHQGGYAICGGAAPGPAEICKIVDSQGITRSLGFVAVNGSTAIRITSMFSRGTTLFVWTNNADNTDAQLWTFIDGSWNAYGALFSKTLAGAMSTTPLAYAERTIGLTNQAIYNFYPSSTNTAVIRQFVPADVLWDPWLTNTSIVKQDGPLYFDTLEMDVMPVEALKAFTAMEVQSRKVDDNTAYGSVNWKVDTGGDHSIAAAEIDQTFDATAEALTLRSFSSSLDPGVAYKTALFRCTLNHSTGTARSPNPLPTIWYISADWKPLRRFSVELAKEGQTEGPVAIINRIEALFEAKNVQRFSGAGMNLFVKLDLTREGYKFRIDKTTLGTQQPTWEMVREFEVMLQQTEGEFT